MREQWHHGLTLPLLAGAGTDAAWGVGLGLAVLAGAIALFRFWRDLPRPLDPRPELRDPDLYGHELNSDDFWILEGRWEAYCPRIAVKRVHPSLGWSQGPLTEQNPWGLIPRTRERLVRDGRAKALFFGDSYVIGDVTDQDQWLSHLLDAELPDVDVLHMAVGGYGPDQMHLMMRETLGEVDDVRLIVMGVMDFSYDRVGLRVRSYQKPFLRLDGDGRLEVTNVPIEPDPARFFRRARLRLTDFEEAAAAYDAEAERERDYDFEGKKAVNRAIIAANLEVAQAVGAQLVYVLLHDIYQVERPNVRGRFFRDEVERLGIPYFDSTELIRQHARRAGTDGHELYRNGHHTEDGNRLVADALLPLVREQLDAVARARTGGR